MTQVGRPVVGAGGRGAALAAVLLTAGLAGCSGGKKGSLVFGISSEFRAGIDLDRLDVDIDAGGTHTTQSVPLGSSKGQVNFPYDVPVGPLDDGTAVKVTLKGYALPETLMIERQAASTVRAGEDLLYRVTLESKCRYSIPGSFGIEPCATGTCIGGTCTDPYVPPEKLEPYDPNWPNSVGDICKPVGAGPASVEVGLGQSDFMTAKDYDFAQVEAGPQGGYHIWVSVRTKNLRRSGSQTEIGGEIPELGKTIDPLKVIFTLVPDEGGYCKLYGLRFQLALGTKDVVQPMLGKKLKVIGKVTDKDGASATGERWVTLSSDLK